MGHKSQFSVGNIQLLLAAAIVAGFRWPAVWSFVLLTKVTPGIGLLWFAVRREWHSLAIALAATALLVGLSFVLAPDWWPAWFTTLRASESVAIPAPIAPILSSPLALRMILASMLVVWGGLTDRRWTVPIAALLAVPVLWWSSLSILVGVVPLLRPPTWRWIPTKGRGPRREPAGRVGGT